MESVCHSYNPTLVYTSNPIIPKISTASYSKPFSTLPLALTQINRVTHCLYQLICMDALIGLSEFESDWLLADANQPQNSLTVDYLDEKKGIGETC